MSEVIRFIEITFQYPTVQENLANLAEDDIDGIFTLAYSMGFTFSLEDVPLELLYTLKQMAQLISQKPYYRTNQWLHVLRQWQREYHLMKPTSSRVF